MSFKKAVFSAALCLAFATAAFSQTTMLAMLQDGILLYGQGNWDEAISALQPVRVSANKTMAGEAFFWTALARLSGGNYEQTVNDIESLEIIDPQSRRITESGYHKGRALFYLNRYDEAIISLGKYTASFGPDSALTDQDISKKAAALYWIGESLYAAGQFDKASDVFYYIITEYPQSAKYEASAYRIELIGQKKIEAELLELLKWSHEDALRIMDDYQRRERAYDQAILSYQKRINDLLKDTRLADLESSNAEYRELLSAAEDKIRGLESRLSVSAGQRGAENSADRLQDLRSSAEAIQDELQKALDAMAGTAR